MRDGFLSIDMQINWILTAACEISSQKCTLELHLLFIYLSFLLTQGQMCSKLLTVWHCKAVVSLLHVQL